MAEAQRAILRIAALLLFELVASLALAQRLPITVFSTDDGLAGTQIWAIRQDRRGYLWIGTSWGLCRYDGAGFATLSIPEGLPSSTVRTVREDGQGRLWIGTNLGAALYDGRALRVLRERDGLGAGSVWGVEIDPAGRVWFGAEGGLSVLEDGKLRTFGAADGLASDYVYSLHLAHDGAIWAGSRGAGVSRCLYDPARRALSCRRFGIADGLGSGVVHSIVEDAAGRMYVGTRGGGVAVWDGSGFRRFGAAQGLASDDVYNLLIDRRGEIVVGTNDRGVSICTLPGFGRCRTLDRASGLPDLSIESLYEDREGTLWIGTESGLARLPPTELRSFSTGEGLPDPSVYAVSVAPDGTVWAGTVRGLARLETSPDGAVRSVRVWTKRDGLPGDWVWSVRRDAAGSLWLATEGGLSRLDARGRVESFARYGGALATWSFDVLPARDGSVWVGTQSGIGRVTFRAPGAAPSVERFVSADGAPINRAVSFAEDGRGRVWVATGEDLLVFERGGFHKIPPQWGVESGAVRAVFVDREGVVWVGGYGNLARLAEEKPGGVFRFEHVAPGSGIESLLVDALGEDAEGHVAAGTNHGLLLIDPAGDDRRGRVLARFDRARGAIASEVSHSSALALGPDGRLWCGFKGGLTVFPERVDAAPVAGPALVLERLRVREGPTFVQPFAAFGAGDAATRWYEGGPLALGPRENNLRVELRALTLRGERAVRFQYQLAGFDAEWSEPKSESFCDYTNLPPGTYVLRARAAFGDGPWGPELALELRRGASFWESGALPGVAALLVGATFLAGHRLRLRQVRARSRELERLVAERTEDLARYAHALEEHSHALDRANERIRQADRHKNEFLAKMSHELRTPLTSILGFSELLERALGRSGLPEREQGYLHNIQLSGSRLLEMINNLLDLARIEAGRMEVALGRVHLAEAVEQARGVAEGYAVHRGVRLSSRFERAPETVEVDLAKLHQILLNLLSNAIKFSPRGGGVEIAVRGLDGDRYEIAVADRGPGIPLEQRAAIFEPFRQLGSNPALTPGSGLGLAIVRSYVGLLGGEIDVESETGQGATFRLRLPVAPAPRAASPAVETAGAAEPRRAVFWTRDRESFRRLAAAAEERGWIAVRSATGPELARIYREIEPALVGLELTPDLGPEGWAGSAELLRATRSRVVRWALFSAAPREASAAVERLYVFDRLRVGPLDPEEAARLVGRPETSLGRRAIVISPEESFRSALALRLSHDGWQVETGSRLDDAIAPRAAAAADIAVLDWRAAAPDFDALRARLARPLEPGRPTLWIVPSEVAELALLAFVARLAAEPAPAPGESAVPLVTGLF